MRPISRFRLVAAAACALCGCTHYDPGPGAASVHVPGTADTVGFSPDAGAASASPDAGTTLPPPGTPPAGAWLPPKASFQPGLQYSGSIGFLRGGKP